MPTAKKLYLDTSVFGGYFDREFEFPTRCLFDTIERNNDIILLSSLTIDELSDAPIFVRDMVSRLEPERIMLVDETSSDIKLANEYIKEKVVGKTSFADCLHIALATTNQADLLVSWNFKHIVNVNRIIGYNFINLKLGYKCLEICSPKHVIGI